jgi:sulfur relay (sulfurtransferase) complex TusBCD TusD component (DsrE family)
MHTSPFFLSNLLYAAVDRNLSPELYGYLDGVYAMHANQQPILSGNIGELLNSVHTIAMKKGLSPLYLASACCATDRGYSTFTDKRERIISSCTIPPVKICNLERIVSRLRKNHQIVSSSSFSIQLENNSRILPHWVSVEEDPPPLVILATQSPYGKEIIYGAFSFALACAVKDIVTRVVFIENGVYTLAGRHEISKDEPMFQMQELLEVMTDTDNLELYTYTPSLLQRGIHVSSSIKHVLPVNSSELAQIVLQAPAGIEAGFQRVFIF